MLRPIIVASAAILPLVVSTAGHARDNKTIVFNNDCSCLCVVEGGSPMGENGILDIHSQEPVDCTVYNGRTCNTVVTTGGANQGLVRTGKLDHCSGGSAMTGAAVGGLNSVLPTTPVQTIDPGDQGPIRPQPPGRRVPGRTLQPAQ